jgi:Uma2 family endonuclease
MEALHEIKLAIERLSSEERRDLEVWIREVAYVQDGVSEPRPAYATASPPRNLSVEEYLKFEEMSSTRHEYIAGELFAMTGATKRHNVISLNIASALVAHLRGGPCRTYVENVKVRLTVKRDEIFYYPDVSVACGPQDLEKVFLTDPKLVVEVLSPSTERTDRREKALNYREIPTVEEYVLVAQHRPEVTLYRRSEDWRTQVLTQPDAVAEFRSIALTLPLGRIYEGVL